MFEAPVLGGIVPVKINALVDINHDLVLQFYQTTIVFAPLC
jgi:hypothetical protein